MSGSEAKTGGPPLDAIAVRNLLDREELGRLAHANPQIALLTIAGNWLAIAALIAAAVWLDNMAATLIAIVFIAGRQHAMLVLMHDGAHRLLFRRRQADETVSNIFLSFPLFISTALYRRHHLEHHRSTNTDDDPDLMDAEVPPTRSGFLLSLAGDLIGLRSLRMLKSVGTFGVTAIYSSENSNWRGIGQERILFPVFAAVVLALLTLTSGFWNYLTYWFVPMWFVLPALLHIRAVAEHAGRVDGGPLEFARTVKPGPLERALIAPLNINLHLEHHLFPDVPFYRLGSISRFLETHPALRGRVRRNQGYLFGRESVLGELYQPSAAMEAIRQ